MRDSRLDRYGVSLTIVGVLAAAGIAYLVWWVPITARWHINRLASDSELDRLRAEAALVDLGPPAVPTLAKFAGDANRRIRLGVAGALAEIGTPQALERLVPMVDDRDPAVRQRAAWALIKDGDTLRRCAPSIPIDHHDPVVRLCAIRLLWGRDLASTVERLIPALEADENLIRLAAVRRLRAVTGKTFGFDAFADATSRAASVARWRAWWRAEREHLPTDRATYRAESSAAYARRGSLRPLTLA